MASATFPDSPLEIGIFDWVECSDAPASKVFEHKLDMVEAADKAGFYGWHLAEHFGTPLALDVSPNVMLASAIQRASRLRLGGLTFCLPWYDPYRFYKEICMLDHLSHGRIDMGVGRGTSLNEGGYYGIHTIEEAQSRYAEALDIFMTAARSDVLNYKGKYNSYEGLEVYNHPYQKPYPPLWYPSIGGSLEFLAGHGYNVCVVGPPAVMKEKIEHYKEVWLQHKDDPDRHNAHVAAPKLSTPMLHVLVADTDAEAQSVGEPAFDVWRDHITYQYRVRNQTHDPTVGLRLVAGTAESVRQQLAELVKLSGVNYLLVVLSFGDLKPEQAMRSLDLFAKDVMPALREEHAATLQPAN